MDPEHDKQIGQGHDFYDFELMQDEYLKILDKINTTEEGSDTYQRKDNRHIQEEPQFEKMSKLRKNVEFLERRM